MITTKAKVSVSSSLLPDFIEAILLTHKNISSYEEVQGAIEKEFNCSCPLDLIVEYFTIQRETKDLQLIHKHYYGNDFEFTGPAEV